MDDLKILCHRKHSTDKSTNLGLAKDPPMFKLAYSL